MLFASSMSWDGAQKVKKPSVVAHKRGGWKKDNLQKKPQNHKSESKSTQSELKTQW